MGGGGGEGAGGCGHALAAFKYSLNTQKMQPGVGSGEGGGVVWAVGVVRARGGVGTHWQPLNTLETPRKCQPGVSSGEAGVGWGVGGGGSEGARGGCGHALAAFKYSLNT